MSIYAISDLHLSFNTNKPMDIFGWENYEERIKKNWLEKVNEKDLVLINIVKNLVVYYEDKIWIKKK